MKSERISTKIVNVTLFLTAKILEQFKCLFKRELIKIKYYVQ